MLRFRGVAFIKYSEYYDHDEKGLKKEHASVKKYAWTKMHSYYVARQSEAPAGRHDAGLRAGRRARAGAARGAAGAGAGGGRGAGARAALGALQHLGHIYVEMIRGDKAFDFDRGCPAMGSSGWRRIRVVEAVAEPRHGAACVGRRVVAEIKPGYC